MRNQNINNGSGDMITMIIVIGALAFIVLIVIFSITMPGIPIK
jgi:hypothetical protein